MASLYRKYRSQQLSEVIGQEHITRTLLNALAGGRVAHAYLFCGQRGTGKTSTARILAKAVNCLNNGGKGEPCNECAMCRSITEGRAVDILEIDAASNNGVDNIRDLRDKINFYPEEARYKFYIIDEVHMLSTAAFNALLKTLEEPPPHAIFVMATTEVHKVPATILSRCQRFDFRRIPLKQIEEHMREICANEGIQIEKPALELIARASTGSMRDALSLLDQIAASGDEITLAQVQNVLGTATPLAVRQLIEYMVRGDRTAGLRLINDIINEGADPRQFARDLTEQLRNLLLVQQSRQAGEMLDLPADALHELQTLAREISAPDLLRAIRLFSAADTMPRTAQATLAQLPLELAFIEATLHQAEQPEPEAPVNSTRASRPAPARATTAPAHAQQHHPTPPRSQAVAAETQHVPTQPQANGTTPAEQAAPEQTEPVGDADPVIALVQQNWHQIIESMSGNLPVQALLRSCQPDRMDDGYVILACRWPFHKERLEIGRNRELVEQAIGAAIGQQCRIRCVVGSTNQRPPSPTSDPLVAHAKDMGLRVKRVTSQEE